MRAGLLLLIALMLTAGAVAACTTPRASSSTSSSPASSTALTSSPTPRTERSAPASGPTSAPEPASQGGAQPAVVPVDLALSGALSGRVVSARPVSQCGAGQVGFAAELELAINGQAYLLRIHVVDFHGPGDYSIPPVRASLRPVSSGAGGLHPAVAGHVSIAANQRSGRLQLTLGTASDTRLQGTWAC